MESSHWESVVLELCSANFVSNWPEFRNDEQCKAKAEEYREQGKLDIFHREFRNVAIAPEEQSFSNFQTYNSKWTEEELNINPLVETAIFCDPGRTMTTGNNKTAIMGVSVNTQEGYILVRDIEKGYFDPNTVYQKTFMMAKRLNAICLCPEVTGLEEYILQPLANEMMILGDYYHIIPIKPREGKTGPRRSGGLIPYYKNGRVLHNENVCGSLEEHLMNWPRPKEWDEIDCLSGIIYALDEGGKFFSPQDTEDETEEQVEKEYAELEDDYADDDYDMMLGDTMVHTPTYGDPYGRTRQQQSDVWDVSKGYNV